MLVWQRMPSWLETILVIAIARGSAHHGQVAGKNQYNLDFKTAADAQDPSLMLSGDDLLQFYADMCAKFPVVRHLCPQQLEYACVCTDAENAVQLTHTLTQFRDR